MGKYSIVIGFLLSTLIATIVFLRRPQSMPKQQLKDKSEPTRIVLEDFTIFRYQGHQLSSRVSAKLGQYVEPNRVELYGDVYGFEELADKQNYVRSQSASLFFDSRGLVRLMKETKLRRADFANDVEFGFSNSRVFTQFAEYTANNQLIRSDRATLMRREDAELRSETGFEYSLSGESLELYGPIQGLIEPKK